MATSTKAKSGQSGKRSTDKKGNATKFGNLTRDPELRFSDKEVAYCRFGLAVDHPETPGDWAGKRTTEFYDVVCFKSLAENVAKSLKKGTRVLVSGQAELEHWSDAEGKARNTKRIVAGAVGPEVSWATTEIHEQGRGNASSSKASDVGVDEDF